MILFAQSWVQTEQSKGAVVLVHGYGEHCGRYTLLKDCLIDAGFSFYAYDQRGHGKSEGLRAYVPRFKKLIDDLESYLAVVRQKEDTIFLLGQSMGGGILTQYAGTRDPKVNGMILCSAALKLPQKFPLLIRLASRISSMILPWVHIPEFIYKLDTGALSHRIEVVQDYEQDPFVYHGRVMNRTGWELNRSMNNMPKIMPKVSLPILIMHGDEDRITHPDGSRMLYEKAASKDKQLKIFPGGYHELFNDRCSEEALDTALDWLAERAG
ncbi:MAG: alpha/beta hydrolase [Acidobacteriota bacterium]|nr:alpha/beta hydrolase [Acidobacteriota bacterium]